MKSLMELTMTLAVLESLIEEKAVGSTLLPEAVEGSAEKAVAVEGLTAGTNATGPQVTLS